MKTNSLISKLSKKYPKRIAEFYDTPGLQINKYKEFTNNILICLDFDETVYDYIINNKLEDKIDLIITHHPFIFGKLKNALKNVEKAELYQKMLFLNIPIVSYHTNFDNAINGMNDAICEKMNFEEVLIPENCPMMRIGMLKEEMDVKTFCKYFLSVFNLNYGLLINEGTQQIKKIGIIGGGGWSFYKEAKENGCDIYISGDVPHHGRREIISAKFNYLDVPHEIENAFMNKFKSVLLDISNDLNITTFVHEFPPELIEEQK